MPFVNLVAVTALTALLACGSVAAAAQPAVPASDLRIAALMPAEWTPKKLKFVYKHGFTTHYSCDGLRDKMKDILTRLGAGDIQIRSTGCINLGGPDVFPGMDVRMNVLQPAQEWTIGHTVPAHWKKVDLLAGRDPVDAAGDCDLIGQIKQEVLPLFVTRNVDYSATCEARSVLPGGTRLTADVLVPEKSLALPSAARQ
jgi:hypothetical protein